MTAGAGGAGKESAGQRSAGRVIAGTARGTKLLAPGAGTRPLADRVKQALFAILEPVLRDATVLDLFAGSGAGGIEALSRGARSVTFVERDASTLRVLEANLERAHCSAAAVLVRADAIGWLERLATAALPAFGVVLIDPPYERTELLGAALERLGRPGAPLTADAVVVAKHFWRDAPPARVGLLASDRVRRFGETSLTFYGVAHETEAGE